MNATKTRKPRLTTVLSTLLPMAVKQTGSYDWQVASGPIEEQLTLQETRDAEAFFAWLGANKRTFGHNLPQVWAEFAKTI